MDGELAKLLGTLNTFKSENNFKLTNKSYDFSFTLGRKWSLTFGFGMVSSGKGTITTSTREYTTSNVSGTGYFVALGMEIGFLEVLMAHRKNNFEYSEFQRNSSGTKVALDPKYKLSGEQMMIGFGFSFYDLFVKKN